MQLFFVDGHESVEIKVLERLAQIVAVMDIMAPTSALSNKGRT